MPIEKSAGIILFKREKDKIYYLLLHYPQGHWDFPKGHIEYGEKEADAAKRELKEETGIEHFTFVKGFKRVMKYFYKREGQTVMKFVSFFLGETKAKKIVLSFEHTDFKWLCYNRAVELLTFNSAKAFLKQADEFLCQKS